jgi:crotonobetainyl-CoA:carnitine CoA-transferase CaiB-like acyl-CoA transferase
VSSQDAVFSILDNWPTIHAATGRLPERVGNRHLATAPYDNFKARDGWVVIAVASNRIFRRLCEAMGQAELASDPRFRGARGRLEASAEINGIVGTWVASRSVAEVMDALGPERANVPCSPVYALDQLLAHPQLLARDMVRRLPHPKLGEVVVPGVAVRLSDTPGDVHRLGPELGADNLEVYAGLLGLAADEIERLRAAHVI